MEEGGRACDSSSKSRGKGEESVDGCQFATVHEEAPRPARSFGNCTKGLAVVSLTCWNGTTCQRNMVCNFSCKMRSRRIGPRCRISYRPLFFFLPPSRCISHLRLCTATKAEGKTRELNVFLLINSIACNEITTACHLC